MLSKRNKKVLDFVGIKEKKKLTKGILYRFHLLSADPVTIVISINSDIISQKLKPNSE